jgi:trimethylamine--corrinoid protein Co-methyltransferase
VKTYLQVLSDDERERVHEHTLALLETKGLRVDTAEGRRILAAAGALVDESTRMVRFPRDLVAEMLGRVPEAFSLGGRRPGFSLPMNAGGFTLLADGGGTLVIDHETGERRQGVQQDWLDSTRLIDAIDDVGLYWWMVEADIDVSSPSGLITYWRHLAANFSKHIQDSFGDAGLAPWLLEALEIVHGGPDGIRATHPFSFLITPTSPLVIEEHYTDMWLALRGYDVPVAVMNMPLMGATAPGSMIGTVVLGNAEVIATLCLVEAAEPGAPFIYAPALAAMDPRSGSLSGGGIEHAVMSAAATEMARYYGLPVEASGCGTQQYVPGIQAAYEKATTALFATLALPDILVGPGSLGGATIISLEQLVIDVEVFRICVKAQRGINTADEMWLQDVLEKVAPAGDFLREASTRRNARNGEWFLNELGVHESFHHWDEAGRPSLVDEAHAKVSEILATHEPLPLDDDVERELEKLQKKADEG